MGTKYSSQTISGYNASPPADDGSTAASNQVAWAKHLSKIGNPLKTLAENINTALLTALSTTVRTITASDSTTAADHLCTIQIASTVTTAAITVSLMDATTAANGYIVNVNNQSTIAHTIGVTTASNTINSATASISILPMQSIVFTVNAAATGFIAMRSAYAAYASVAAHATTCNPWVAENVVLTGGAVTFTDIADAPYVGARVRVKQNAAHTWTSGAVFSIKGAANYTATVNDWVEIYATTVSTFELSVIPATATEVIGYSQTVINATFDSTVTKIAEASITTTRRSSVSVDASLDAYCTTAAGKTFRIFIRRDAVAKASGPYQSLDSAAANSRGCAASTFAESGLAAGTYAYQIYAQNTTDATVITVGDVAISVHSTAEI